MSDIITYTEVDDLFAEYKRTRNTVHWPIEPQLKAAVEVSYRSQLAVALADESPAAICQRYVYMSAAQMSRMLDLVQRHVFREPLKGKGIELGSGPGLLSAVAAARPGVEGVIALEVCEHFDVLITKVAESVLGASAAKVVPVVGSFNDLRLPDRSLDFALDCNSLHHSHDLPATMKECGRVLKPGGVLICFDRCHPDTVTNEQVNEMLDRVYSKEFLEFNHYPTDVVLTRRENGEHEYRYFEWKAATESAGMEIVEHCEFVKEIGTRHAMRDMTAILPRPIRRRILSSSPDRVSLKVPARWAAQRLCKMAPGAPIYAAKGLSVLIMKRLD